MRTSIRLGDAVRRPMRNQSGGLCLQAWPSEVSQQTKKTVVPLHLFEMRETGFPVMNCRRRTFARAPFAADSFSLSAASWI